ncbi:MAG: alpha-galactosidase [Caldilinea sp.]|nr:alpha-galactosidase [Caldilineaceae bacterium]MCB9119021.1 alpha-galactosidase [Caldilineaceae bacterium]MCW5841485.1 alpha-galactosidase [Caldilinea sp.]
MEETLATCATAFVTADPGRMEWTIGNDRIRKTVTWRAHGGLRLTALENRTTGRVWQPALDASSFAGGEFLVQWEAVTYSARQATELLGIDARTEADAVLLYITLRVAGALDVTVCCRLHSGADVFEQWLEISARQPGVLSSVAPLTISAASVPTPTLHWVRGIQNHGAGMPDSGPYPAFQVRHEALGAVMLESGLRSTWHEIAWLALDSADDGDGLFTGLLYSGRWSAAAQAVDSGGVTLDLSTAGYALPLAAGEQWTSPAAFVGLYHGDLDDAAHVQHAFMRAAVVPPTPDDFPWVQYNTWFAHLVDYDEELLRQEAELAAKLGAEVFVIDAGWWEPSRRTSDNFTTGLGAWKPSDEKFPSGIPAFGDYVRALGMRFGIWVEPERVDMRHPATWQLTWLVRHHDAIVSPPWPPDTVSGWLCFGHPDVQAWAIDWISRLMAEVGADWIKWDSNWWGVCTCANHGHSAGDGEFYQVEGVHIVIAELRRRFPNLIVENCAGGGTRTDFAMLRNTHITWLHDASTPSRRVRFHLAGATYLFPPELCNTWVVDADDESLMDPSASRADLNAIARSRMVGAFGVSARLMEWTDAAFAAVQEAIVQYKQLRPLLKRGRFYHLLPQAELACTELDLHGQWEAYAIVDAAGAQGALWLFRAADGEPERDLCLRGLVAERTYALEDIDTGQTIRASGASLMADGFRARLGDRTSALLLLRAV